MSAQYVTEVDYDTRCNQDGSVTIDRRVFRTRLSGRGREHGTMEIVESTSWELASTKEAFKLARDIFETLAFYQPTSVPEP